LAILEKSRLMRSRVESQAVAIWLLSAMLATPVICAEPAWIDQRQVGPFVCVADFPLAGFEPILAELPALELELRRVLGLRPCSTPIHLYLLADRQRHQQLLKQRYPEIPYRRALYVQQNDQASVYVYRHDELAVDIRHECTHALLHADLPMVPLWLDEGLAEYFEVAPGDRPNHNPHLRNLKWNIHLGHFTEMRQLERKQKLEELRGVDYQQAWAWTHFMLHGPQAAHGELVAYLSDIRRRQMPGAMSERLEKAVPDTRRAMAEHFKSWNERYAAAGSPSAAPGR
jgi:hypothetical protein